MARPQLEGLSYFPHDTYASSDEKLEPLILLYGSKGYAFYFLHLEYIYRNKDLEFDISDAETREVITQKLHISADEYNQILQTALKKKCFDKNYFDECGKLTSEGIKKRAVSVLEKRERMRVAYEARVSAAETTHIKESKEKKSKVKKSIIYSSEHVQMAKKLKFLILQNNPGAKTPDDLTSWTADFDKMTRLDKRTLEQINIVMEFSQKDSFWKSNILSAGTLREKFDTLLLQKDRNKPQSKPEQKKSAKQLLIEEVDRRLKEEGAI